MARLSTVLRVGESIGIGPDVRVTLESKDGQSAKLVIDAPQDVRVTFPKRVGAAEMAVKFAEARGT